VLLADAGQLAQVVAVTESRKTTVSAIRSRTTPSRTNM